MKAMIKHGILKEVNDINKFFEGSPSRDHLESKETSNDPTCSANQSMANTSQTDSCAEIFPFQWWARSYSPPKLLEMNNIIKQWMLENKESTFRLPFKDKAEQQKYLEKWAVIASANFLMGAPEMMMKEDELFKGKEVEEWLLGSGEQVTQAYTGFEESEIGRFLVNQDTVSGLVNSMQ